MFNNVIGLLKKMWFGIRKEATSHPIEFALITIILLGSFFVRAYRTTDLMAFHYDQARDALKVWDFWHKGDIFLVGPVTGLAGIFLGPLYYFMIAPFYLMGGGNPLYPAILLTFLGTVAIYVTYLIGLEIHSRPTGILAAIISGLSYYLILAGRWVSNPTPIFLGSVVLFYCLLKIIKSENNKGKSISSTYSPYYIGAAIAISASLQFESASAFFYLPIILIFLIWQKGRRPDKKTFIICVSIFFISIIPQLIFSLAHQNMLIQNFANVFTKDQSFKLTVWDVITKRSDYFWTVFASKILPTQEKKVWVFLAISILGILSWKSPIKTKTLKLFLIFLGVPVVGYTFFQGNHGNMYDYYMTGYYLPMIILFSLGLGALWEKSIYGKIVVAIFLLWFSQININLTRYYLSAGVDGPTHVSLGNELQAVNWVYNDASKLGEFNADFYVPPVIPYTYDYLFLWQGTVREKNNTLGCVSELCGLNKDSRVPIVYVLFEVDPPHPERLENWLLKYKDTSKIIEEVRFGGITVQKRERI